MTGRKTGSSLLPLLPIKKRNHFKAKQELLKHNYISLAEQNIIDPVQMARQYASKENNPSQIQYYTSKVTPKDSHLAKKSHLAHPNIFKNETIPHELQNLCATLKGRKLKNLNKITR